MSHGNKTTDKLSPPTERLSERANDGENGHENAYEADVKQKTKRVWKKVETTAWKTDMCDSCHKETKTQTESMECESPSRDAAAQRADEAVER